MGGSSLAVSGTAKMPKLSYEITAGDRLCQVHTAGSCRARLLLLPYENGLPTRVLLGCSGASTSTICVSLRFFPGESRHCTLRIATRVSIVAASQKA